MPKRKTKNEPPAGSNSVFDPVPGETERAHRALLDFIDLGKGKRSVIALVRHYQQRQSEGDTNLPTISLTTAYRWSMAFSWTARAKRRDEMLGTQPAARMEPTLP